MTLAYCDRDPIVEAVRAKLLARSQAGIAKYGTDLTRTDLTRLEWLRHWQEELLDAANYAEVLIQMAERREDQRAREQEALSIYRSLSGIATTALRTRDIEDTTP